MFRKSLVVIGLIIISSLSFASDISTSVIKEVAGGAFRTGIGSTINLQTNDAKLSGEAIFLGRAVRSNGDKTVEMYLKLNSKKVFYIESSNFNQLNPGLQAILDPYEQSGGTCAGYAMDNFLQQLNLTGFTGTKELGKVLSSEEGRTSLLVDTINQYYLTLQHRYSITGIMNGYGKKFGFKCKNFKNDSIQTAKSQILAELKLGQPIIFSFNIGPDMVKSPFSLEAYGQPHPGLDNRLWVPREIGQRNNGGHSIVAAASFSVGNKTYLVVIDSDWSEPRVWDLDTFLNSKTAISEIDFISCH